MRMIRARDSCAISLGTAMSPTVNQVHQAGIFLAIKKAALAS